jgi:site-specific DNA recombinase
MCSQHPLEEPPTPDLEGPNRPIAAVLYAAKSTIDEHGSIPTQLADCRALAKREDWEVVGEFQDEGFSAYSGNRGPGLEDAKRLLEQTAAGRGSCVLAVQHSDRVARGAGNAPGASDHLVEVVLWLNRCGGVLRTVQDDYFEDRQRNVREAANSGDRNTEDSRRKSQAVKDGKRRAFERGDWQGGPVPDGYLATRRVDERGGKVVDLEIDPEREPVLRMLVDLANEGHGDPTIARTLNKAGHRTRAGNAWTRRQVQNVLTNHHYAGLVVWRRGTAEQEVRQGRHPALMPPERFERLLLGRASRDKAVTGRPRGGRPTTRYALAKLGVCDECGSRLYATTSPYKRKDGTHQRSYTCAHVHMQDGLCNAPKIPATVVDGAIIEHLDKVFVDFRGWIEQMTQGVSAHRDALELQLNGKLVELAKHERREAKLREHYLAAIDSDTGSRAAQEGYEHVIRERDAAADEIRALQERLAAAPAQPPTDALLDVYNGLAAAIRGGGNVKEVNERLRANFKEVRLRWVEPGVVGVLPVLKADVIERYATEIPVAVGPDGARPDVDLPPGSPVALFAASDVPPVKSARVDVAAEYAAYLADLDKTGKGSHAYLFVKWNRSELRSSHP